MPPDVCTVSEVNVLRLGEPDSKTEEDGFKARKFHSNSKRCVLDGRILLPLWMVASDFSLSSSLSINDER